MSKKNLRNPEVVNSRQLPDHNSNKVVDLKQVSSPNKKSVNIGSKILSNNKNSNPNSNIKHTQDEIEGPDEQILSIAKNRTKQEVHTGVQPKTVKKVIPPVSSLQNAKKFSKTSKIPTLRSTNTKGASDQLQSELKTSQTKMEAQQSSAQKSSSNDMIQQSSIAVSTLKSQIDVLKTQNDELKKQNDKLNKKIQKLKNLNDQNKKLLKDRIQSFNSEGENIRKLKSQIYELQKNISQMKGKMTTLESQNIFLKESIQKTNTQKVSREIQTVIIENQKQIQAVNNAKSNFINHRTVEKKYQSSSSRRSYGGILPLETVVKLNAPKFKINFKTPETTPKRIHNAQHKLVDKYQNYWSEKVDKLNRKEGENQSEFNLQHEVKSQFMGQVKIQQSCQIDNHQKIPLQLDILTNMQKLVSPYHRKQLNDILQSIRFNSEDYRNVQNKKETHQGFSPTILIENYQKISEQQELIKSLYRVIQQLSREIESVQKQQQELEQQNRSLKVKLMKISLKKQKQNLQFIHGASFQKKSSEYDACEQLKDDTLLLDQTKQLRSKINGKLIENPLTSSERIKKLLIMENLEDQSLNERGQEDKVYRIQSAQERELNENMMIDDISRFVHSDVVCRVSYTNESQSEPYINNSIQDIIESGEQKLETKSKPKKDEAINSLDDFDKKILSATSKYSNQKPLVEQIQQPNSQREEEFIENIQDQRLKDDMYDSQQPHLKIEDSLDALEYFQMHTPHNISSNLSYLDQNSINQALQCNNQPENTNKNKLNILQVDEQTIRFTGQQDEFKLKQPSQIRHPFQRKSQNSLDSYRKRRLYEETSNFQQKSQQDIETTSKQLQLDQMNIYQDSIINPNTFSTI